MRRGEVHCCPSPARAAPGEAAPRAAPRPPRAVGATVAALLASGVAVVFVPALLGRLVDVVRGRRGAVDARPVAVGLLVALVARAVFTGLGHVLVARLGEQALADLRERVVRRALRHAAGDRGAGRHGRPGAAHRRRHHRDLRGDPHAMPAVITALIDVGLTLVGLAGTGLAARPGRAGAAADLGPRHPLVPACLRAAVRRGAGRRRRPDPGLVEQPGRSADGTRLPAAGAGTCAHPARPPTPRSGRELGPDPAVPVRVDRSTAPRWSGVLAILLGRLLAGPRRAGHPRRGDRGGAVLPAALQPADDAAVPARRGAVGRARPWPAWSG